MASTAKQTLIDSQAITAASTTGTTFGMPGRSDYHVGFLKATSVNAATTVTAKIQHSPNGTDWFDLVTFTNIVGTAGSEVVNITAGVLPNIRGTVTLAGATKAATILVEIYSRERS